MAFPSPPKAVSPLGYHRTLAPTCGLRVSPLCLGAMSLGDAWAEELGAVKQETAYEILDFFYEQFVDLVILSNFVFAHTLYFPGVATSSILPTHISMSSLKRG